MRPGAQGVPFRHNGTRSSDTYGARLMINPRKKMRLQEVTVGVRIMAPKYIRSQFLEPVNVTLYGKRVFADVMN